MPTLSFIPPPEHLGIKSLSSVLLISTYILGLVQRGRYCFCAACTNSKMYLEIRSANEGALSLSITMLLALSEQFCNKKPREVRRFDKSKKMSIHGTKNSFKESLFASFENRHRVSEERFFCYFKPFRLSYTLFN